MSHVATVDVEIKDLDALAEACKRIGLEFVSGQQTYRWYGMSVGDYPLPAGFTADELGKCEHAIRIPGSETAYEIGVVCRRDGRAGHTLMWDFWAGGKGLEALAGKDCRNLKREYAAVVAKRQAQRSGFQVNEQRQPDGSIRMVLSK
jgi:hypothetical protein